MQQKTHRVLGHSFEASSLDEVLARVQKTWQENGRLRITTVNPEFLVLADKDRQFFNNLTQTSIRTVDGTGLWLVLRLRGFGGKRITGRELTRTLLLLAEKEKRSVVVVLKRRSLTSKEQADLGLQKMFPKLQIHFYYEGEKIGDTDLTLFALGAPEQEYRAALVMQGVSMGIGGSIDFLVGTQKTAPNFLQKMGLEWLWRLAQNPKRFRRIWNATGVFLYLVLKEQMHLK
jgi:N-acetylglucosaminyldiphosphoundecaprenol N-acetyl-beta-D-mannosaminyltransferase